jgi:uncharacterized membrane protein YhaH (DUF805 family)
MSLYLHALQQYATFSGRARRAEYWYFFLFNALIMIGLMLADLSTGLFDDVAGIGLLSGIYAVGVVLPALAVTARRLHDTGRSGWWILLLFIPFLGPLVILVFSVMDSEPGENRYGPNPKDEYLSTRSAGAYA